MNRMRAPGIRSARRPRQRALTSAGHSGGTGARMKGFFNTGGNAGPGPQQAPQDGARHDGRSPFSDINQQLVNMGFPRWNLGNQVVEPVMSILFLFLILMMGVRGLLLVGLIYVVSHLSQR